MENFSAAINFLVSQQQPDGSFLSDSSPALQPFQAKEHYETIYLNTLLLTALNKLSHHPELEPVRKRLANYLLTNKSPLWTWNYWSRTSTEIKTRPYPDDLDDTFIALAALQEYDNHLITGEVLAFVAQVLTMVEQQEGGPYGTWVVKNSAPLAWHDVDLAVNNNVAYFLHLQQIELPHLVELTEKAITTQQYSSAYYPNPYPIIYFISRWYRGTKQTELVAYLEKQRCKDGSWANSLNTALALSSLNNLNQLIDSYQESLNYLTEIYRHDGHWPAEPICLDPAKDKQVYYAGSAALTTAYCLVALLRQPSLISHKVSRQIREDQELSQQIQKKSLALLRTLPKKTVEQAQSLTDAILNGPLGNQIILLPKRVAQAVNQNVPNDLLVDLGSINLLGWLAFTIFDHIIDNQPVGKEVAAKLLPIANSAYRQLIEFYYRVCNRYPQDEPRLLSYFTGLLNRVDLASSWEVNACHFDPTVKLKVTAKLIPDYGTYQLLADRSISWLASSLPVLFSQINPPTDSELKQLISFFSHYLIARQLNDDAHDWQEDLRAGSINSVAAQLMHSYLTSNPPITISQPDDLINLLEPIFLQSTIETTFERIKTELDLAHQTLKRLSIIKRPRYLYSLLEPEYQTVIKSQEQYKQTRLFLTTYQQPTTIA